MLVPVKTLTRRQNSNTSSTFGESSGMPASGAPKSGLNRESDLKITLEYRLSLYPSQNQPARELVRELVLGLVEGRNGENELRDQLDNAGVDWRGELVWRP